MMIEPKYSLLPEHRVAMTAGPEQRIVLFRWVTLMLFYLLISSVHAQPAGRKSFTFRGKVEQVNTATKRLIINGEKTEGWMDAMTMAYVIDRPEEVLARVKVGDQIAAKVYEGDLTLYEVQVLSTPSSPPAERADPGRRALADLERMALANNPTLKQAEAQIAAAAGRAKQAGLYPNPTLSVVGEEISSGPIIRGGEVGGGFQQRIVTGGKLGLSRQVADQERLAAEQMAQAQRQRVLNAVRSLYYQALGDQRLVQVRGQLAGLAGEVVRISGEMGNVGQADRPDQLFADIEAERLDLGLVKARNALERTWRQITAVVNDPSLRPTLLEGDLEEVPKLEADQALEAIYAESPELQTAQVNITRSEIALKRARREPIPDILMSGGVRYNRELLELQAGGVQRRPVGPEGFFDIGIQIPIFNRNQGAVAAAKAETELARREVDRTKLALKARLATVYREYRDAMATVERYRGRMIPKAQQAYELYLNSFRGMAAAYPQVLISQRNLFQLQEDYVTALVAAWQSAIDIQGLLLTGGVELATDNSMPGASGTPMMRSAASGGGSGQN
ncbi:MAG: TolC family protein [Bryobacteraceae bacterium]|nr:TolC family protein [Bryobacteraceae bacterium]